MTKEQWLHLRGKPIPEIPMIAWYECYESNVDSPKSIDDFVKAFQQMSSRVEMTVIGKKSGIPMKITAVTALKKLNEFFDKKFGL